MAEIQVVGLEKALAKAEGDAETALKAANSVVNTLRRYRNAARQGQIRDLRSGARPASERPTS